MLTSSLVQAKLVRDTSIPVSRNRLQHTGMFSDVVIMKGGNSLDNYSYIKRRASNEAKHPRMKRCPLFVGMPTNHMTTKSETETKIIPMCMACFHGLSERGCSKCDQLIGLWFWLDKLTPGDLLGNYRIACISLCYIDLRERKRVPIPYFSFLLCWPWSCGRWPKPVINTVSSRSLIGRNDSPSRDEDLSGIFYAFDYQIKSIVYG